MGYTIKIYRHYDKIYIFVNNNNYESMIYCDQTYTYVRVKIFRIKRHRYRIYTIEAQYTDKPHFKIRSTLETLLRKLGDHGWMDHFYTSIHY